MKCINARHGCTHNHWNSIAHAARFPYLFCYLLDLWNATFVVFIYFKCEIILCVLSFWQCTIIVRSRTYLLLISNDIHWREWMGNKKTLKWWFEDGKITGFIICNHLLFFIVAQISYLPIAMHMKETFFFPLFWYILSLSLFLSYDIWARNYWTAKVFSVV